MSGTAGWPGNKTAGHVEERPPRVRPADAEWEVPSEEMLASLPHEERGDGDERQRHYLVEIRYVWLQLGPTEESKACGVFARPDGQITYRLFDATHEGGEWAYADGVYASVLVDGTVRDPEPLDGRSVETLREAYQLVLRERHGMGGDGS